MTYTVVGGGPSAARLLPSMPKSDRIITTNAGINLCKPDWYYLNDLVACERHAQAGRESGAVCMTARRGVSGLITRGIVDFAQLGCEEMPVFKFTQGSYTYHPLSGVMCVQMAVNFGASLVRLVGFDGYTENERLIAKNKMQTDALQSIVDNSPRTVFEWYGESVLGVTGENVLCPNLSC
jgi:hypothetical protein